MKTTEKNHTTPAAGEGDFLKIDELRLDREWVGQAELYYKHAARAAKLQRDRDTAKATLDVVRAELSDKIRRDPDKYGLSKLTEASIDGAVVQSDAYKLALSTVNETAYMLNVRQAAVNALEHRKRALTMLVQLHNANYFADPKVQAGQRVKESMEDATQRRVAARTQVRREVSREDAREDAEG